MAKVTFGAIIFFIAWSTMTSAFAQHKEGEDVLRGLEQVYVSVERLKPEIERDGLYSSTLQSDVEMTLKMAGMKIFERGDSDEYLKVPCLILQVNALKIAGGYVYDTRVFLREPVVILRKRAQVDGTTLRLRGQFGCTTRLSDIREEVRDTLGDFVKAWQEANGKAR